MNEPDLETGLQIWSNLERRLTDAEREVLSGLQIGLEEEMQRKVFGISLRCDRKYPEDIFSIQISFRTRDAKKAPRIYDG